MTNDDAITFREPINILPMGGGYDWRDFTGHGPYFLCKDGLPLRDSSKYNREGWRIAAVEVGREEALVKFAAYVAGLEASNESLRQLTMMALEAVDEMKADAVASAAEKAYRE